VYQIFSLLVPESSVSFTKLTTPYQIKIEEMALLFTENSN
jgi:hypothetical protein